MACWIGANLIRMVLASVMVMVEVLSVKMVVVCMVEMVEMVVLLGHCGVRSCHPE